MELVEQLQSKITILETSVELLTKAKESYLSRISALEEQVKWFQRQLFGAKSEKRSNAVMPLIGKQVSMFPELEDKKPEEKKKETTITVKGHTKKKSSKIIPDDNAGETGLRFGPEVEVKEIIVPNPSIEGLKESEYEILGENVHERLCQRKGSYYVERRKQLKVKIKASGKIEEAPAPERIISSPYVDVSLLVGIVTDKFQYHLPLYRQHQRMTSQGIYISRGSVTNWTHEYIDLLKAIYVAQRNSVLNSKVLSMDETPHKAGRRNGGGKMSTCYYWFLYGDQQEVIIHSALTRGAVEVKGLLKDFKGTLFSDGYTVYELIAKELSLVLGNCWSHGRRYFIEAEEQEPISTKKAVDLIREIYRLEDLGPKDRDKLLTYRVEKIRPKVDEFFEWIKSENTRISQLPSTSYTKAVKYMLTREGSMRVFLSNPDVPLDNNHTERAVRPIVLGRKNYLFCWTEVGAEKVAIIQSLIYTCQLQGINPWDYLMDVSKRISTHPASRVNELTPRLWKEHFGKVS